MPHLCFLLHSVFKINKSAFLFSRYAATRMCYELEGPWWRGLFCWIQLWWECCLQHWRRWEGMLWERAVSPWELGIAVLMSRRSDFVECCDFMSSNRTVVGWAPKRGADGLNEGGEYPLDAFLWYFQLLALFLLLPVSLQNRIKAKCIPFASDQNLSILPSPPPHCTQFIQWNIHKSGSKVSEYGLPRDATGPFVLSGYSGYKQVQVPRGRLFAFDSEGNYMLTCSSSGGVIYKVTGWRSDPEVP